MSSHEKAIAVIIIREVIKNGKITRIERETLARIPQFFAVDSAFVLATLSRMLQDRAAGAGSSGDKGCPSLVFARVYERLARQGLLDPEVPDQPDLIKLASVFRIMPDLADTVRACVRRADRMGSEYGHATDTDWELRRLDPPGTLERIYGDLLDQPEDVTDLLTGAERSSARLRPADRLPRKRTGGQPLHAWQFIEAAKVTEPGRPGPAGALLGWVDWLREALEPKPAEPHLSERVIDALSHASGPVLVVHGLGVDAAEPDLRVTSRPGEVLWMGEVTRELVALSVTAARRSLQAQQREGHEPKDASWAALRKAILWLRGDATAEELEAAHEPARLVAATLLTFSEPARAALCALEAARDAACGAATVASSAHEAVRASAAAAAISSGASASVKGRSSYEVHEVFEASKAEARDWYGDWITRVIRYRMQREGARTDT